MYYDIQIKTPFLLLLSGSSGSGKTSLLEIESKGRNATIVLDNFMHEMLGLSDIGKLFTKGDCI